MKNIIIKKILRLTIDNNRDISDHISIICKTANQKLNALFTVSANINSDKCTLLINSFLNLNSVTPRLFGCSLTENVNKIQERYLRLVTNNYELNYDELLDLTNEISPQ